MNSDQALDQPSLLFRLGPRYVLLAIGISALLLVVLAIPTAIIANPLFSRMTPVEPEQYAFWLATGLITGALLATYAEPGFRHGLAGRSVGAGMLGVFAIGCPICNKLVLALLGASGALTYFAPLQPLLGFAAVSLAGYGLWLRLGAIRGCRLAENRG